MVILNPTTGQLFVVARTCEPEQPVVLEPGDIQAEPAEWSSEPGRACEPSPVQPTSLMHPNDVPNR